MLNLSVEQVANARTGMAFLCSILSWNVDLSKVSKRSLGIPDNALRPISRFYNLVGRRREVCSRSCDSFTS